MAQSKDPTEDIEEHVVSPMLYVGVFATLLVLTFLTVMASGHDFGPFNTAVALGIACVKAMLVILFFMHARWSGKLTAIVICSGLLFLAFLIGITLSDYLTRHWSLITGR
jgi:cytochrome c oxidase subunit IV